MLEVGKRNFLLGRLRHHLVNSGVNLKAFLQVVVLLLDQLLELLFVHLHDARTRLVAGPRLVLFVDEVVAV